MRTEARAASTPGNKSFLLLFFKKEVLPAFLKKGAENF